MSEPALMTEAGADAWEYSEGQRSEAGRRPGGPPVLSVEGFEGPLDFLLDMVRRQRVNLGPVSIGALCGQFVTALEASAGRVPLDRQADWVVMASELRQWEELRVMQAAAAWLAARPQHWSWPSWKRLSPGWSP